MATEIQLPADGLRFKDLVQFTRLTEEEFVAACASPFLLQVPVEQPKAGKPKPKPMDLGATQRFRVGDMMMGEPDTSTTLVVEPEDVVKLVRSRSGKAADEVLIHMLSPQAEGEEMVVVGRDERADVIIDMSTVSKYHAELSPIQTDLSLKGNTIWQLTDLGSMNGTIVDGQRVEQGTYTILRDRSDIRFGTYQGLFLSAKTLFTLMQRIKGG